MKAEICLLFCMWRSSLSVNYGNISSLNPVQRQLYDFNQAHPIDRGLQWRTHIDKLCGRLAGACYALSRMARVVTADVVRACFFATVQSLLQYGTELWARAADWERAFRMQKRAVRAIAKIPSDQSARPYFKSLGILTLPCLVIYQVALYVRQNLGDYATRGSTHGYATRGRDALASVSRSLAKSAKQLTHVMGPQTYNKIHCDVKEAHSLPQFKRKLKRCLIEQTFYSYNEFIALKTPSL